MQARKTVSQYLLKIMVELGGAEFKGCQDGFRNKHGAWIEALCMFNSPATGSTLALPVSQVSATAVRRHVLESDATFEAFREKACTFVLRQFAEGQ